MFHSRDLNNKINHIHERALRITYQDNVSTFDELLNKDCSIRIHHRNIQFLAIEMYKFLHRLSPPIISDLFVVNEPRYNLRQNRQFSVNNVRTVRYGTETISFMGPKIWAHVPADIKYSVSLPIFKSKIRSWKRTNYPCRLCKTCISNVGFI